MHNTQIQPTNGSWHCISSMRAHIYYCSQCVSAYPQALVAKTIALLSFWRAAGGAGGSTTYDALQKADAAWAKLRNSKVSTSFGLLRAAVGPRATDCAQAAALCTPNRLSVLAFQLLCTSVGQLVLRGS